MKIKVIDTYHGYKESKKKLEVETYFLNKYNTDNKFKNIVDNKGFISISYKEKTNEILVFAKVSKTDYEGWETITYHCNEKQKNWFEDFEKGFTKKITIINRSEKIKERKQLIESLKIYSNHELKNNKRAEETLSFRDLNLLTATQLLDIPSKLIKQYRRYGFSSNSFNSYYYIYIHEKDIKFVNKNLDKILRDEKVKQHLIK